ncbi:MAG: hypothetical protein MUQ65_16830, partial [Armatimonadetes bacterium]|nr:hypothetical protein [Armatimonadota bacterium]
MMSPRRRRASAGRLIALIVALLLCIWLLYKLFIGIPPAPPPGVKTAVADGRSYPHHLNVFSISSLAWASLSHPTFNISRRGSNSRHAVSTSSGLSTKVTATP